MRHLDLSLFLLAALCGMAVLSAEAEVGIVKVTLQEPYPPASADAPCSIRAAVVADACAEFTLHPKRSLNGLKIAKRSRIVRVAGTKKLLLAEGKYQLRFAKELSCDPGQSLNRAFQLAVDARAFNVRAGRKANLEFWGRRIGSEACALHPSVEQPQLPIAQCGNGICEEVVCMALGCPHPETAWTCPSDCRNTSVY